MVLLWCEGQGNCVDSQGDSASLHVDGEGGGVIGPGLERWRSLYRMMVGSDARLVGIVGLGRVKLKDAG